MPGIGRPLKRAARRIWIPDAARTRDPFYRPAPPGSNGVGRGQRHFAGPAHIMRPSALRSLAAEEIGEAVPQDVLLHLAHGVARQFVDEDDALGLLEAGEPFGQRAR